MKFYKSPSNEVFAYEDDGSQDAFIPEDFIAITEAEADVLRAPPPATAEQVKAMRAAAYHERSDPLFFKAQRGEATQQEWLDEVAAIRAEFP